MLTLRVILVASEMVVCSVHCHSKGDCTGGVILKLIGITFSTRLDEAQLTKHAHRENCVTDKVGGWEPIFLKVPSILNLCKNLQY